MSMRTYLRTLFNDIFRDNIFIKVLTKIVNFYCDIWFKDPKSIKLSSNMPINNLESKKIVFFQSVTGDEIDCK